MLALDPCLGWICNPGQDRHDDGVDFAVDPSLYVASLKSCLLILELRNQSGATLDMNLQRYEGNSPLAVP